MMHPIFAEICNRIFPTRPKFQGWQADSTGKYLFMLFMDPLTGSTFAVRNGGNVTDALARSRGKFGESQT